MLTWHDSPGEVVIRCPRCGGRASVDTPFQFLFARKIVPDAGEQPSGSPPGWRWQHIDRGERGSHFVLLDEKAPNIEERNAYLLDNRVVIEKYPSVMRWATPDGRPNNYDRGRDVVIKCSKCHLVAAHQIAWPEDAYFQWDIRGHKLWAWSEEHARVLLEFLGGAERDETKFGYHARSLRKLPGEIISAKARDLVVKEISATLEAEGANQQSDRHRRKANHGEQR